MKGTFVTICITIGALWLADVLLNDGRYGDVIQGAIMALVGR